MVQFTQLSLPLNLALFVLAGTAVWFAGVRLTRYANSISRVTGIGHAIIGIVLLAGITSLPEIGVTATAAIAGNADLAVNNLFGSIAMQVALLAIVDFVMGRRALTAVVPEPVVILEGSLNIIMISIAAAAMIVGDVPVLGIGAWAWGFLVAYIFCVWTLANAGGRLPWLAASEKEVDWQLIEQQRVSEPPVSGGKALPPLLYKTAAVAVVILVAGYVLAQSGEAIANQTGLGSSFTGFVLVALATSLPELSTALSAARRGLVTLAISDILGTNLINVAMIFLVDLLSTGEPVLNRLDDFAVFGALLAVVLTALFQAGLAERRDRSLLRMGYDSIVVAVVYIGGVILLYGLRAGA